MIQFKVVYSLEKPGRTETDSQVYQVLAESGLETLIKRYCKMMENKGFLVRVLKREPKVSAAPSPAPVR